MKLLLIGDVHAVPEELNDCRALVGLILDVATANRADVLFLGDQYDSHNLIRTEVLWFWRETFLALAARGITSHALVGNHDISGAGQALHSMISHEHDVNIIDKPTRLGSSWCLPFYHDRDAFLRDANATELPVLICHQTFEGSRYEGGFFAQDGVAPNLLNHNAVLSGHIHTPQSFQVPNGPEVTYIGAPRWRILSDANVDRAIWQYELGDKGVLSKQPFDTATVCRQIRTAEDNPVFPLKTPLPSNVDWRISIHGPADWVEKRKGELAGPGVKIRGFVTSAAPAVVKESEGISTAFRGYLKKYTPKHGTDRAILQKMAEERLHV